jgi:hypothetical protein
MPFRVNVLVLGLEGILAVHMFAFAHYLHAKDRIMGRRASILVGSMNCKIVLVMEPESFHGDGCSSNAQTWRKPMKKVVNGGLTGALALLLVACASQPPVPSDQLAVARNAIDYAVEMGARDHAPGDLQQARQHLAEAERAVEQGENKIARQLALEAEKIARLADRKSRSAQSRRQVEQLEDTVEALREEISRAQGGSS